MTDVLIREEEAARPAAKRPRRSRWRTVLFITLLVSFGLVVSGVLPLQQYFERETQVDAAREELAALTDANAAFAEDVDALLTDQEIERIAREQYGFVRPGEVGYVVIVPEGEGDTLTNRNPTPVEPVEVPESPGFFKRIWLFLTGGDVVDDG